jgi:hypothetical protein
VVIHCFFTQLFLELPALPLLDTWFGPTRQAILSFCSPEVDGADSSLKPFLVNGCLVSGGVSGAVGSMI